MTGDSSLTPPSREGPLAEKDVRGIPDDGVKEVGREAPELEPSNAANVMSAEQPSHEANYIPFGPKLFLIVASLMLGVFCMALDNNVCTLVALQQKIKHVLTSVEIIAVAIPRITDEFHDLDDVGWYGSAYLLPACGKALSESSTYVLLTCA